MEKPGHSWGLGVDVVKLKKVLPFGRWSLLFLLLVGMSKAGRGQAQTVGRWSILSCTMPINPIHVALLYNGKLFREVQSADRRVSRNS
jgi:hypothetical protein